MFFQCACSQSFVEGSGKDKYLPVHVFLLAAKYRNQFIISSF